MLGPSSDATACFIHFFLPIQDYLPVDEDAMTFVDNDHNIYDFYVLDDNNAQH